MAKNDLSNDRWGPVDQPFETEDEDLCPLCMEELDISDLNFRPCPCGYRICRFCWHHIKEDLNRRCPGCRKEYDDSVVEFKPMKAEELKRFQLAKKQREKERKDLESVNRKHLANVRVKQKNQVHVQGLTTKIANEDTLVQLKSSELFSQYGRIQKMFMSRRTGPTNLYTPDTRYQHVNLYINFSRNNEAMACIQGLDGTTLPDGHRLKASLGSTKYCSSFLRGVKCPNDNCTCAHELAEEVETGSGSINRDDASHSRHVQRDSEGRSAPKTSSFHSTHPAASTSHAIPSGVALPATASWAAKSNCTSQPASPAAHPISLPHHAASNGMVTSKPLSKGVIHPTFKSTQNLSSKPRQASPEGTKPNVTANSNHTISSSSNPSQNSSSADNSQPSREPLPGGPEPQTNQAGASHLRPSNSQSTDGRLNQAYESRENSQKLSSSATISQQSPNASLSTASLPPGLGSHPPGLGNVAGTASAINRGAISLPPGLEPSKDNPSKIETSAWGKNGTNTPLLGSAQRNKLGHEPLSEGENVLSNFSPNFEAPYRISVFGGAPDSLLGSLSLTPSSGYSGTFNPFADSDFPLCAKLKEEDGLFAHQQECPDLRTDTHLGDRRGSRFGFARRNSSGLPVPLGGVASSPLRSIFSHTSIEPGSPHAVNKQSLNLSRAAPLSASRLQDTVSHLAASATESATPDASVLFPGVNLAASYSANALPAALARGAPGVHHAMDAQAGAFRPVSGPQPRESLATQVGRANNDRMPFGTRPAALSPTALGTIHPSGHHQDHLISLQNARERRLDLNAGSFTLPGQFPGSISDLGSEFHDPAILNMRMANNSSNGYGAPLLQTGDGGHAINEIYPPFSMNNGLHSLGAGRPTFHPSSNHHHQDLYGFGGPHPSTNANGNSATNRLQSQTYYNLTTGALAGQPQQAIRR